MKRFLTALAFALLGCVRPQESKPATPTALESTTVAIVQPNKEGKPFAICAGVWVSDKHIVTAAHCVSAEDGLSVYTTADAPKSPSIALIVKFDEDLDIAVLQALEPAKHTVPRFYFGKLESGMEVLTMGHPMGMTYSFTKGVLASGKVRRWTDTETDVDHYWLQSAAPIGKGNSGGGLFTSTGALIGICVAYDLRGQNLNYYVPASDVAAVLGRRAP